MYGNNSEVQSKDSLAEIKEVLKSEKEEKQLRLTEMEVNKASNLLAHREEILSRPPCTWINKKRPAPCGERGDSARCSGGLPSKKLRKELAKVKKDADKAS